MVSAGENVIFTEPFTNELEGHVLFNLDDLELPQGGLVATIHTHGAYVCANREQLEKFEGENDEFSGFDRTWSQNNKIPIYLVSPDGCLQYYTPKKILIPATEILKKWTLPHDKNHPELPEKHKEDCPNCFERQQINDE